MQHKHLLPDEIDLLVDGEDGPQAALLHQRTEECGDCAAEMALAIRIAESLDALPHSAPAPGFQNRVMARVEVFEPWHVTLADTLRSAVPRTGPVRTLVASWAGVVALTLTGLAAWASFRADLVIYAVRLGLARAETAMVTAGGSMISDLFGDAALTALRDGGTAALAIGAATLLTALAGATYGLRRLTVLARQRGR